MRLQGDAGGATSAPTLLPPGAAPRDNLLRVGTAPQPLQLAAPPVVERLQGVGHSGGVQCVNPRRWGELFCGAHPERLAAWSLPAPLCVLTCQNLSGLRSDILAAPHCGCGAAFLSVGRVRQVRVWLRRAAVAPAGEDGTAGRAVRQGAADGRALSALVSAVKLRTLSASCRAAARVVGAHARQTPHAERAARRAAAAKCQLHHALRSSAASIRPSLPQSSSSL